MRSRSEPDLRRDERDGAHVLRGTRASEERPSLITRGLRVPARGQRGAARICVASATPLPDRSTEVAMAGAAPSVSEKSSSLSADQHVGDLLGELVEILRARLARSRGTCIPPRWSSIAPAATRRVGEPGVEFPQHGVDLGQALSVVADLELEPRPLEPASCARSGCPPL